jgi:hypothetical protein
MGHAEILVSTAIAPAPTPTMLENGTIAEGEVDPRQSGHA